MIRTAECLVVGNAEVEIFIALRVVLDGFPRSIATDWTPNR
jgi:hypothetical protein